jgi:hypothetical protein
VIAWTTALIRREAVSVQAAGCGSLVRRTRGASIDTSLVFLDDFGVDRGPRGRFASADTQFSLADISIRYVTRCGSAEHPAER